MKAGCRGHRLKASAGFTLVELLLALVITSIAVTSIYGIFHTSLRAYHSTSESLRMDFESGLVAAALGRDLRGAVFVEDEEIVAFAGEALEIEFFTTAVAPGERRWPLRRVVYRFEKSAEQATGTLRAETQPYAGRVPLQPESTRQTVLTSIGELRFRYYSDNRWQEEWRSGRLPQAVEISGTVAADDGRAGREFTTVVDLPCFSADQR